jgi:hypothetical protein
MVFKLTTPRKINSDLVTIIGNALTVSQSENDKNKFSISYYRDKSNKEKRLQIERYNPDVLKKECQDDDAIVDIKSDAVAKRDKIKNSQAQQKKRDEDKKACAELLAKNKTSQEKSKTPHWLFSIITKIRDTSWNLWNTFVKIVCCRH